MTSESSAVITTWRIRTRRTYSGTGQSEVTEVVPCGIRESAVPADCGLCPRCLEVVAGADGRKWVHCMQPPRGAVDCASARPAQLADPVMATAATTRADVTPVAVLMNVDVICARPDLRVDALAWVMASHRVSGVPVVDEAGLPIGMVSQSDVVEVYGHRTTPLVREIMMPIAFTLREESSIAQAAALMATEQIHRLPVVSANGSVVGIVSSLDVCRWMALEHGYLGGARPPAGGDAPARTP